MNYEAQLKPDEMRDAVAADADGVEASSRKRRGIIIALIVLAIAAIGAFVLTSGGEDTAFAADDDGATPAVTVTSPGSGTIEGVINATGTIAARREMPVGIAGEGGRVVSVAVDAGDWVRAGQTLAVIDRSVQVQQVSAQGAQIDAARADAALAQSNLDRALQLVDRGFISQANIDQLTATRDAAKARVALARAQYRELQARNARLNVVAPAAGLVLTRNVEPGQIVSPGTGTLFSIARGGEMEVMAELGEADLATLSTGVSATVTPVGSSKQFTGQVWQVAPVIDETDRQGVARVALAYAPELRPGGFATVQLNSGTVVAPMLPESAILSDEEGSYVYIVDGEDIVVRRPVELGLVTDNGIAIASGLDGSERVVMRAGGFLNAGEKVRPVTPG